MEELHPIWAWMQERQHSFWKKERLPLERPPGFEAIRESYLLYLEMEGAFLRHADLSNFYFNAAICDHADFGHASLRAADFHGCSLDGASFRNADMTKVRIAVNCSAARVSLACANLASADLRSASLRYSRLDGADLRDAQLPLTALSDCHGWHGVKNIHTARFFEDYGETLVVGISFNLNNKPYVDISGAGISAILSEEDNAAHKGPVVEFRNTETYRKLKLLGMLGRPEPRGRRSPGAPNP